MANNARTQAANPFCVTMPFACPYPGEIYEQEASMRMLNQCVIFFIHRIGGAMMRFITALLAQFVGHVHHNVNATALK